MGGGLHLIKLCVGCDSPAELAYWQARRWGAGPAEHVTRMWPTRAEALLAGGSLYWVFRGVVLARQKLVRLEARVGADGVRRCGLILGPALIRTQPQPRRAFQGWRYLRPEDAPPDLPEGREAEPALPPALARELLEMGVL